MEKIIDTNIILRYLVQDNYNLAKEAESIIKKGVKIYPEILSEVIYVLEGVYDTPRKVISNGLKDFLDDVDMDDKTLYTEALTIYNKYKLDFVDCILLARYNLYNDDVYTFDKKLKKLLN